MNVVNSLNEINSTNLRVTITLLIFVLTAISYLYFNKTLDWEWLAFLGTMSGLDMTQYIQKRKTHIPVTDDPSTMPSEDDSSNASTDVQELSQNAVG